jgi:hypothetical protein
MQNKRMAHGPSFVTSKKSAHRGLIRIAGILLFFSRNLKIELPQQRRAFSLLA